MKMKQIVASAKKAREHAMKLKPKVTETTKRGS